jgi:hypothetical protein
MPVILAIAFVLAGYAFFAGDGKLDFRRLTSWEDSYYASQAEGFFRGHLHIERRADPKLTALPYPYDEKAREGVYYLWDASYLNGKYYLYYSPLPVLLVHMPFRILRGAYPPDALVALIFAAWAFLASVVFARRALDASGRQPHVPIPLWILFIGLGNVVMYVLSAVHIYEVAVLTGMATTATWALALQRFNQSPTIGRGVWVGLWLALSIAARPNLGVLLVVTGIVVIATIRKRERPARALLAFLAPLAIVAIAMISYNMARFGSPLEFGQRYQLTHVAMEGRKICSLCTFPEATRFTNNVMHYLFWPIPIRSKFPYLDAMPAQLDPAVSWPTPHGNTEQVVGIAPLIPLTMLGTFFAILFVLGFGRAIPDHGTRSAIHVAAGAWLILFGLSSCWWIVSRYSLDFMMLLAASSVVCIEAGFTSLSANGVRILPLRIAVALMACYSIVMGLFLGLVGPGRALEQLNPPMFHMLEKWFS